jgi:geranylgeranyl diphosphate synthase, type II
VAAAGYPDELRLEVEGYLETLHFTTEAPIAGLDEAMRYSLLAGGKRIRPVLALATARGIGMEAGDVLPLAGAIELIHTYSLIHDDLPAMDDDDLRRGRPTCHVRFGEDVAILAGDALYAEAFRLVLTDQQGEPARVLAAVRELADATGASGMVGGQYLDVAETSPVTHDGLRRLHELKTGRLIGASVECVLLLGEAPQPATIAYRSFAAELGVLFQIVDDILDVTGTDADLGKPQGSDERLGKRTYVSEFGLERARELASESHAKAQGALAEAAPAGAPELEQITDFIYTRTS